MAKQKHIRIGSTKVRSGCLVCKARRIKCDETKPTCRNCTRSNRVCVYSNPPQGPNSNLRIVVYTPCAPFAITGAEKHSLDFFLGQMRSRFPVQFTQPVLQAAHRESVLGHAVIALGAMQQVYEYDDSSAIGSWSPLLQFAMQQYGKALRLLQERAFLNAQGMISPDVFLISCIFFTCFECLRGSVQAAMVHMRSGLNLLREYENAPRTGYVVCMRTMRALFTRLDNQLIEMRGSSWSMTIPQDNLGTVATDLSPEDNVHDSLNSLWNHILHGMLDSARALAKGEPAGQSITTPQIDVKKNMRALHEIFIREPHSPSHTSEGTYGEDTDILRIWFLLSPMLLTAHIWDPAYTWDPHNDNFARIVSLAEGYLERHSRNNPSKKRTFTFSLGVIPPLVLTATRSRDRIVQQKALRLLSICNRREGIWDSKFALQFAQRTIELDKSVGDQPSEEQAATRLKNRAAAFDDLCANDEDSP